MIFDQLQFEFLVADILEKCEDADNLEWISETMKEIIEKAVDDIVEEKFGIDED